MASGLLCIMVTYNSASVVDRSLSEIVRAEARVLVVDNSSADDTVGVVKSYPGVQLLQTGANLGFARAVNLGMQLRRPDEHVLLLNPDAILGATALMELVAELERTPNAGAIAPLVVDPRRPKQVVAAGRFPRLWPTVCHWLGLSRVSQWIPAFEGRYLRRENFSFSPRDVEWASGGCLLIKNDAVSAIGTLDERYFMYSEDVQYCLRLRRSGWRVLVDPGVEATHAYGSSSSRGRPSTLSAAWLVNSFDLYASDFASTPLSRSVWILVTLWGLRSRAIAHAALSRIPTRRQSSMEANRYYRDLAQHFLAGVRARSGEADGV